MHQHRQHAPRHGGDRCPREGHVDAEFWDGVLIVRVVTSGGRTTTIVERVDDAQPWPIGVTGVRGEDAMGGVSRAELRRLPDGATMRVAPCLSLRRAGRELVLLALSSAGEPWLRQELATEEDAMRLFHPRRAA